VVTYPRAVCQALASVGMESKSCEVWWLPSEPFCLLCYADRQGKGAILIYMLLKLASRLASLCIYTHHHKQINLKYSWLFFIATRAVRAAIDSNMGRRVLDHNF